MIPLRTKDSIDRYVNDRVPPGDFLEAVLSNDLMQSFALADVENKENLFDICRYIYIATPLNCNGSREKVNTWLNLNKIRD